MIDKSSMIHTLRNFPNMVKNASTLGEDITTPKELVQNIVVMGMGGSGFTGDLLKTYLYDTSLQIFVIKDYILPKYVNRKSMVFAISYSGNTEETISAYRSAVRRGCKVICICSGGKLAELAKMNKNPFIKIPTGIQPRLSVPYLFIPILNILNYSGLIDIGNSITYCIKDLNSSSNKIEQSGKRLAQNVKGKIPIIYSSQRLFAIAEKWKTDINENAKTHVFYNVFPEFNHNEICGFQNPNGKFHVIILNDSEDDERIKKRINVFKKVMAKYDVEISEIGITGNNFLTRLLSTIWMGQFLAYYLALEYNVDPTPVEIIEAFKKKLK